MGKNGIDFKEIRGYIFTIIVGLIAPAIIPVIINLTFSKERLGNVYQISNGYYYMAWADFIVFMIVMVLSFVKIGKLLKKSRSKENEIDDLRLRLNTLTSKIEEDENKIKEASKNPTFLKDQEGEYFGLTWFWNYEYFNNKRYVIVDILPYCPKCFKNDSKNLMEYDGYNKYYQCPKCKTQRDSKQTPSIEQVTYDVRARNPEWHKMIELKKGFL